MTVLPRNPWLVSGRSSTNGASSAAATTAPIAVFTTNWPRSPGIRPSGPASGEAATPKAATAISAISTRRRARWCTHPTGLTASSASTMPAANQEKKAGGHVSGLTPKGTWNGIRPQAKLAAATTTITGMRAGTGSLRASSARIGNAR